MLCHLLLYVNFVMYMYVLSSSCADSPDRPGSCPSWLWCVASLRAVAFGLELLQMIFKGLHQAIFFFCILQKLKKKEKKGSLNSRN